MSGSTGAVDTGKAHPHDISSSYTFTRHQEPVSALDGYRFTDSHVIKFRDLALYKSMLSIAGLSDPIIDRSMRDVLLMWSDNLRRRGIDIDVDLASRVWDNGSINIFMDPDTLDLALYIADRLSSRDREGIGELYPYIERLIDRLDLKIELKDLGENPEQKIHALIYAALCRFLATED